MRMDVIDIMAMEHYKVGNFPTPMQPREPKITGWFRVCLREEYVGQFPKDLRQAVTEKMCELGGYEWDKEARVLRSLHAPAQYKDLVTGVIELYNNWLKSENERYL